MAKEFMLLVRNQSDRFSQFSDEKNQEFLKSCENYVGNLMEKGKLKSAQPLVKQGKMISGSIGAWKDTPFNESNEVIVGYYHILAEDIEEAVEIAKRNPEFAYTSTARIEVRPIKTGEDSTGYIYPAKH